MRKKRAEIAANVEPQHAYRECPFCKESMRADAIVCPHCRHESTFGGCYSMNARLLLIAAVLALVAAGGAFARGATKDPRVCAVANTPAKVCANENAVGALRGFMEKKDDQLVWNATIKCTGSKPWLRWNCTFSNETEKGTALVTLGSALNWQRHVVLKSYALAAPTPGPGG